MGGMGVTGGITEAMMGAGIITVDITMVAHHHTSVGLYYGIGGYYPGYGYGWGG